MMKTEKKEDQSAELEQERQQDRDRKVPQETVTVAELLNDTFGSWLES